MSLDTDVAKTHDFSPNTMRCIYCKLSARTVYHYQLPCTSDLEPCTPNAIVTIKADGSSFIEGLVSTGNYP